MARPLFDGETYVEPRDRERLVSQLVEVWRLMCDRQWHTLGEIEGRTGYPQASISARLRDLRKTRFGEWRVKRRYVKRGLFEYKLLPPLPEEG